MSEDAVISLGDPSEEELERGRRFGRLFREGQARVNKTNRQIAEESGVSPSYVGILRNDCYDKQVGKVKRPSKRIIYQIAPVIDTPAAVLIQAAGWVEVISEPRAATPSVVTTGAIPPDFEHRLRDIIEDLRTSGTVRIPVLARVAAGVPMLAAENIEDYIFVSREMVPPHEQPRCFAVRVRGKSMEGALIGEGDLLIVRQQDDAEDGQIVAALVNADQMTVKRLRKRRGVVLLESDYMDGRRDEIPLNGGKILGLVIGQRRDYHW
jgi:SOS-response transcriptional repressor LexA